MKLTLVALLVAVCAVSISVQSKDDEVQLEKKLKETLKAILDKKAHRREKKLDKALDENLYETMSDLMKLRKSLMKDAEVHNTNWQDLLQQKYDAGSGGEWDNESDNEDGDNEDGDNEDGDNEDGDNEGGAETCDPSTVNCNTLHSGYNVPWVNEATCGERQAGSTKSRLLDTLRGLLGDFAADNRAAKVVEGHVVSEAGSFPWVVALMAKENDADPGDAVCGGSLIAPQWVLTAAHCFDNMDTTNPISTFQVRVGEHLMSSNTEVAWNIVMDKVFLYPAYDTETIVHDIALIKLATSVDVASHGHINTICLEAADELVPGAKTNVSGWGQVSLSDDSGSDVLRYAELTRQAQADCECLECTQFCTLGVDQDSNAANVGDSCQGDSGGPLFSLKAGSTTKYKQDGVVSYGGDCGDAKDPGVNTFVPKYVPWIAKVVNEN